MVSSYVGENKEFARQFLAGELEVALAPQGTLAERLRTGGAGIAAFYTPAGAGTQIADGGLAWRHDSSDGIAVSSLPKECREFGGRTYILERGDSYRLRAGSSLDGDRYGNLVYRQSAGNFNPDCAPAGRITIAEVEELVDPREIEPAQVHTPGVFVHRVVHIPNPVKRIEKEMVRS